MPRFLLYALVFFIGAVCGLVLTVHIYSANKSEIVAVQSSDGSELWGSIQPQAHAADSTADGASGDAQHTASKEPSILSRDAIANSDRLGQKIPESYRQTIGPAVRQVSFGQRFRDFEAEPIDESWAQAMEVGINDLIATHGPASGEVFEFVQCRSSNCVVAGYTLPKQEPRGASVIGQLSKQPWWAGGGKSSATYLDADDRTSFVILIRRSDN